MKTALITGITGQDGLHLTELLLQKGYRIVGMIRGSSVDRNATFQKEFPEVELIHGDLTDQSSLVRVLDQAAPDEIYNLAALSFVGLSFKQPEITTEVTGLGPLRLLEALRICGGGSRVYQASSSEMFGMVRETPQREDTAFYPRSPYGAAKAFAHHSCVNYREAYSMWVSCGILFNHEGPRRGPEFVTRKISKSVAAIRLGRLDKIRLGRLDPSRDWGYAGDYVLAMWLMLQHERPDDFVVATGLTHTVEDFVKAALEAAGLEPSIERFVELDESFMRPTEVDLLKGDSSKARRLLGWSPTLDFEDLVGLMVENDLRLEYESGR